MKEPLVSIITPSFNHAPFLEQCIRSVLNQNYPNIEYIVIDGGSTDGSVDVIRQYEDRISYWESRPDNGQSAAINKGFRRARGDIVAWLNSDDVYFPGAVKTAVKRFQEKADLVLFYGHCVFIDEGGSFVRYFTEVEPWDMGRLLNFTDFIMQPTTFFAMNKLKEVGFLDETLNFGMDWDLWCKLAKVGDVHFEEQLIAANREYEHTKTNKGGWARLGELLKIQRRHMTGVLPHAFFGYVKTEFYRKAMLAPSGTARLYWQCLAKLLALMDPVAKFHNRRLDEKRNLYGLKHHSGLMVKDTAQISLPIKAGSTAINLVLKVGDGAVVLVETSGLKTEVICQERPISLRLPIDNEAASLGIWSAKISVLGEMNGFAAQRVEVLAAKWEDAA